MAISRIIISLQAEIVASVLDNIDEVVITECNDNEIVAYLKAPVGGKPRKIIITTTEEEVDSIPGDAWVQAPLFGQK